MVLDRPCMSWSMYRPTTSQSTCDPYSWLRSWCIAYSAAPFRYTIPYSMHHGISLIPTSTVMGSAPVPSVYIVQLLCCFGRCVGTARVGYLTATVVQQLSCTTYRVEVTSLPPRLQWCWFVLACHGPSTDQRRANPRATTLRGCKVGASPTLSLLSGIPYRIACTMGFH